MCISLLYSLWLGKLRRLGNILGLCLLHGGDQFELRSPLYLLRPIYTEYILYVEFVCEYLCEFYIYIGRSRYFSRHVYKFIIGRPITYADYAYYDPVRLTSTCSLATHFLIHI